MNPLDVEMPDLPGAACRATPDPEVFFPRNGGGRPSKAAGLKDLETLEMCSHCDARERCLEWALANDEQGIWGGTTDDDRRGMSTKPMSQEQRRRAVRRLHQDGLNDVAIATELDTTHQVVQHDRVVLGLVAILPSLAERRAKVAALHAQGLNDREIAAELDASRDQVRNDRNTLGLTQNHRKEPAA